MTDDTDTNAHLASEDTELTFSDGVLVGIVLGLFGVAFGVVLLATATGVLPR